jgi:hypothetical protein
MIHCSRCSLQDTSVRRWLKWEDKSAHTSALRLVHESVVRSRYPSDLAQLVILDGETDKSQQPAYFTCSVQHQLTLVLNSTIYLRLHIVESHNISKFVNTSAKLLKLSSAPSKKIWTQSPQLTTCYPNYSETLACDVRLLLNRTNCREQGIKLVCYT